MTVYIITTTYPNCDFGFIGTYSSVLRARKALENYFNEASDIVSFQDVGNYCYQFVTTDSATYGAEIVTDILDYEYMNGELKDED